MLKYLLLDTDFTHSDNADVDLKYLIMQEVDRLELLAKNRQLVFSLNLRNVTKIINQQAMEKVIENLLQNAVKYSDENTIIDVILEEDKLVIRNKKTGLIQSDVEKFFQPFYSTNQAGTGLGLYLVSTQLSQLNFDFKMEIVNSDVIFVISLL